MGGSEISDPVSTLGGGGKGKIVTHCDFLFNCHYRMTPRTKSEKRKKLYRGNPELRGPKNWNFHFLTLFSYFWGGVEGKREQPGMNSTRRSIVPEP